MSKNEYNPDYAVHPGELLDEYLECQNEGILAFEARSGLDASWVMDFLEGKPVRLWSLEAEKLERATGRPAHIWLNMDKNYWEWKEERQPNGHF